MRQPRPDVVLEPAQADMADLGLKGMIPIAGRPFLDYVLSALADAGYERACLVIRAEHELVRKYYRSTAPPTRISVAFAIQDVASGTAGAVLAAETFVGRDEFLMVNSDNYYPVAALAGLRSLGEPGLVAFQREGLLNGGNITPDRLNTYAAVFLGPDGYLERIVEKPDADLMTISTRPAFVSMNCWRFSPQIFPASRAISPSHRGELELADAVQYAISALGERFRAIHANAPVLDLSNRGDVAAAGVMLQAVTVCT
jgi:glucose-1-phosphate thymidylyltransferase